MKKPEVAQAVILAGGLGTRLRPLTETMPKCLAPVNGRPFLDYLLKQLADEGVTEVVILTGYKGEQVEQYVGSGSAWSLAIRCHQESELLGTGGALKHAEAHLQDVFMVCNGDTIFPIPLRPVMESFFETKAEGLVVVCDAGQDGLTVHPNVEMDDRHRIIRYQREASDPRVRYVDGGVEIFKKSVLSHIHHTPVSLEESVYQPLIHRGTLFGWPSSKRFYDMGTYKQLKELEKVMGQ